MMNDSQPKAIIIGATSGMGKGLALKLIENGWKVGITGRREANLIEIQKTAPDKIFFRSFDVSNTEKNIQHINELIEELGGLDLFFFSSGAGFKNEDLNWEEEEKTINVNVIGFTQCIIHAYNFFRNQKHGHIAAISSVSGFRGNPDYPAYFATKSYNINYLESLRIKSFKYKLPITVTDIRPGFVNTTDVEEGHRFWTVSPEKAVDLIYKGIIHKRNVVYVSKKWIIIAAFMKFLPRWIYKHIMKK